MKNSELIEERFAFQVTNNQNSQNEYKNVLTAEGISNNKALQFLFDQILKTDSEAHG